MIETLDFKLDRWAREAKELATCVECYGVGEGRNTPGRACPVCAGRGRAAREPHVLELVERLRLEQSSLARAVEARIDAEIEADQLRLEVDRLRGIVEVNDQRLAAVWDEARAEVERLRDELHRARHREGED